MLILQTKNNKTICGTCSANFLIPFSFMLTCLAKLAISFPDSLGDMKVDDILLIPQDSLVCLIYKYVKIYLMKNINNIICQLLPPRI